MFLDLDENVVGSINDLSIVEAQYREALFFHEDVASNVMPAPGVGLVAISIDFDDDACREPGKISNIGANRRFTAEASAIGT